MKKIFISLLFCSAFFCGFSQNQDKISSYLLFQYNHTISDFTKETNPWGVGVGFQIYFNNKSKFKPTIELTGDAYFFPEELVSRIIIPIIDPQYTPNSVYGMINLFVGSSYDLSKNIFASFVIGPSLINETVFLGIKPSLGFYITKSQKYAGKISYINVFDRIKNVKKDFASLSISISRKLF